MTLYSYIVKHDTGFAPNPFYGYCTLACCKPDIRRTAHLEDWVVGLTPKAIGNRIVYFMKVDEILGFAEYWRDKRFKMKVPEYGSDVKKKCGDNIYEPLPDGGYRQHQSTHSNGPREDPKTKAKDLRGERVLISETFAYFGSKALELPPELLPLRVQRFHRCRFSDDVKAALLDFVGSVRFGVHGSPRTWPDEGDKSCVRSSGCKE